ncbi:MAG: hypothetical protein WAM82_08270 [Thermoanaerobaculia bacterium]
MLDQDHPGESPADSSRIRLTMSRLSARLPKYKKKRYYLLLLALLGLGSEELAKHWIIDNLREWQQKQPTKIVLAVFPDTPTARPMADGLGFDSSRSSIKLKEGWRLDYMAESGTIEGTELALKKRLEDENVVLVVGHDSSSTVKALLDTIYRETGIPLILPAVTNPDLTTVLQKAPPHILRLPPTDDIQVATLRQLLGTLNPESVVLMLDNSNVTYSKFIATQLIATGRTIPFVDSVGIGLSDRGFEPGLFLGSKPDVLVFIGMEVQADILLRRLKHELDNLKNHKSSVSLAVPTLVFTDGVAGELFDEAAKGLPDARVYLTCPLPPSRPKGQLLGQFPTYKSYAIAARGIIDDLITEVGTGKINRESIRVEMEKMMKLDRESADFGGLKVKFDIHGNNVLGAVHVFELTRAGVMHSAICPCLL